MQESGIYRILNIKTGKMYIGSAINITKRLSEHFSNLRRGVHHCIHLQRSYDKWGKDAFDSDVVEYVDNIENLLDREQYYIDNIGMEFLYNTNPSAKSPLGVKRSLESRAKIRAAKLGKVTSKETKEKLSTIMKLRISPKESLKNLSLGPLATSKIIQKVNIQTGEVIDTYHSIREAERETGILRQNIIQVCQKKRGHKTAGGYMWKYLQEEK